MKIKLSFLSIFFMLCFAVKAISQTNVEVDTRYGTVQGTLHKKKNINIFLGIPYAQPPVEELRWKAPRELDSWKGVKETKYFGPSAVQENVFGDMIYRSNGKSEDCLYLNIWTPNIQAKEKMAVLVYFYGGGFVAGDGSEPRYDGAALAQKGIITVTVNYRLNIFGFLAHPDLSQEADYTASGNYGLLDQNAALKWVYENISSFGGDPERISIGGESAGSISVSAQMASPLSKDMLAGAIGESGASIEPTLAPVSLAEAEKAGEEFVQQSGYTFKEFRSLPTDSIFKIFNQSGRFGFPTVIDGYFLPKTLPEIFRNKEQAQIPLLLGWNSAEVGAEAFMQDAEMSTEKYIAKLKEAFPETHEEALAQYPAESDSLVRMAATNLASDRFISYSTWKWADLHANNSEEPVYRYLFRRIKPSPDEAPVNTPIGASHASEIEYFLGNLNNADNNNLTSEDFQISETIQKYLVNFVKTGNPNGNGLVKWPSMNTAAGNITFLIMDTTFETKKSQVEDRYHFLDKHYGNNE